MTRGWTASVSAAATAGFLCLSASAAFATDIQRVVSPGGIEAWLVEERAIPIITIQLHFEGGAAIEPPEKAGLARFYAGMIEEGAGPYDAPGFAAKTEELAARFGYGADRDSLRISASMLLEKRDATLELLRTALHDPRFDPEPVERVRQQILSGIRQNAVDPNSIAARAWLAAAFPDHPYGRPTTGTEDTVSAITIEDLKNAPELFLNRGALKIGVVGAISAEELGPILDTLLLDLPNRPMRVRPIVEVATQPGVNVIDFEAPQSRVVFGHGGILRQDADFIPAFVMNHILGGGGFTSRLMEEVRVKRGLAYGVYSFLAPYDQAGAYRGSVGTANERVAETIGVIREQWRRMLEEGVTEEELDKAKRYLTGAYPLGFDTNGKIARFLVGAQVANLGIDYIDKRNDLVNAVTVDDIRRVAERLLKPDGLSFVVVGQPQGLN